MKIVIFGLSVTSSWGNGHATTFRALAQALHRRGHRIVFFEKDVEWYASNRDMPRPPYCEVRLFDHWDAVRAEAKRELADCDVALVGSYFPFGTRAAEAVFESPAPVKAFYDIDTPITMAALRQGEELEYLRRDQIAGFDLYFSFTGGPALQELEREYGARRAVPLYCSFDPDKYHGYPVNPDYKCELSYMGTYAPDRQPKLEELLCDTARRLPGKRFIVAGPQYPEWITWPVNVERIIHLNPQFHPEFYSSSRLTLNVTRRDMVMAGFSPSVRLFEAAACGATIVSDNWPGLDTFFTPGEEILLPTSTKDVVRYLTDISAAELKRIGQRAQERVLAEHSSMHRAAEFEKYVNEVRAGTPLAEVAV